MNSKIIIKYDAETKNPTIECEGSYFSTDRLYGIEIADWAYPFVLNGNRWKGLYDELREFYGMDSYSVILHGADSDLAALKQAFYGRPVNVVGLNNKVIIIYDSKQLTTKITVNGKIFNTQRIDNRSIDEWINPFSFKAAKWNGIYKEIEEFLGIDSYSIHFVGNQDDMCLLHFKDIGLYVYASTESIMKNALRRIGLHKIASEPIKTDEGDILRIDKHGDITRSQFQPAPKYSHFSSDKWWYGDDCYYGEHEEMLFLYCNCFGVDTADVELLLEYGYTPSEVEEMLTDHSLLRETLREVKLMIGEDIYDDYCYRGAW